MHIMTMFGKSLTRHMCEPLGRIPLRVILPNVGAAIRSVTLGMNSFSLNRLSPASDVQG